MANSVVLTKCGFGYNSVVNECNFYLKGSGGRLLASFINGTLGIFDNFVECEVFDDCQKDWDCNDFLTNVYLGDIPIVFVDWAERGHFNYLAVECSFNQARAILENFLDCYGEMQIIIENNFD